MIDFINLLRIGGEIFRSRGTIPARATASRRRKLLCPNPACARMGGEEKEMEKIKKHSPAIFSGPLGWGWMKLGEIAECVGKTPGEVFSDFIGLSKEAGGITMMVDERGPMFVWDSGSVWEDTDTLVSVKDNIQSGEVFVPAGWGKEVVDAVLRGVKKVRIKKAASLPLELSEGHIKWSTDDYGNYYEVIGTPPPITKAASVSAGERRCFLTKGNPPMWWSYGGYGDGPEGVPEWARREIKNSISVNDWVGGVESDEYLDSIMVEVADLPYGADMPKVFMLDIFGRSSGEMIPLRVSANLSYGGGHVFLAPKINEGNYLVIIND